MTKDKDKDDMAEIVKRARAGSVYDADWIERGDHDSLKRVEEYTERQIKKGDA